MSGSSPADLGVVEAAYALRRGSLTAEELVSACIARIRSRDSGYGAWLNVYADRALDAARVADRLLASGAAGPLTGIPIGLKDMIGVAGLPLTADSNLLAGNTAAVDATAWQRLRAAGMVLVGHLHCGEFACGSRGVNPWGADLDPGGSSSGSGIALAARMIPAALGTETRGSIVLPAAFLNCTALKPTFGLVSTAGCIPTSFSYDVVGPMARSAADCAVLLATLAGPDQRHRATLSQQRGLHHTVEPSRGPRPLRGTRIGVPRFHERFLHEGVADVYERMTGELVALGASIVPFDRPANPLEADDGTGSGWKVILGAEVSAVHAQFEGRRHEYGRQFRALFDPIRDVRASALEYVEAQIERSDLAATWRILFEELGLDAVLEPVSPQGIPSPFDDTPPATGGAAGEAEHHDPLCGTWNDASFPVLSLPGGTSPLVAGPVGMQLVGLPFTERRLLRIGVEYQAASDHHLAVPPGLDDDRSGPEVRLGAQSTDPQPPFVWPRSPLEALLPR